jgi:hypothetical protein
MGYRAAAEPSWPVLSGNRIKVDQAIDSRIKTDETTAKKTEPGALFARS